MSGPRQKRQNTAPTSIEGNGALPPRLQRGRGRGRAVAGGRGRYGATTADLGGGGAAPAPLFLASQPGQSFAQAQAQHAAQHFGRLPERPFSFQPGQTFAPVLGGYPVWLPHKPPAPRPIGLRAAVPAPSVGAAAATSPLRPTPRGSHLDHHSAPSATLRDPAAAALLSNVGSALPRMGPPLGHFPHPSVTFVPPPLDIPPQRTVSQPHHAVPGIRPAHRAASLSHTRVGPPPKAILGGPGGRTFDERAGTAAPSPLPEVPPKMPLDGDAPIPASPPSRCDEIQPHPVSAPPDAPVRGTPAPSPAQACSRPTPWTRETVTPHSAPLPRSPSELSEVEDALYGYDALPATEDDRSAGYSATTYRACPSPPAPSRSMHTSVSGSTAYLTAHASTPSPSPPTGLVGLNAGTKENGGAHWTHTTRAGRAVTHTNTSSRSGSPPLTVRPLQTTFSGNDTSASSDEHANLLVLHSKNGRAVTARRHSSPVMSQTPPQPFRRTFSVADAVLKRPPRGFSHEKDKEPETVVSPAIQEGVTAPVESNPANQTHSVAHADSVDVTDTYTDAVGKADGVREGESVRDPSHTTSLSIDISTQQRDLSVESYPISALSPSLSEETRAPSGQGIIYLANMKYGATAEVLAETSARRKRAASHTSSLRPSASIFTPSVERDGTQREGIPSALGLFTFTHKLRPNATEFKPSRSVTGPAALPSASALELRGIHLASAPEGAALFVPPRKSDPITIEAPQACVHVPAPITSPWRHPASPRCSVDRAGETEFEGGTQTPALGQDTAGTPRETPRRGRHTAKRSSQNSHLPRAWAELERSQPPTPTIPSPIDNVHIQRSRPIRLDAARGHVPRVSSALAPVCQATTSSSPCTADTFSPIAALPSELDLAGEGALPSASLKSCFGDLNPLAEPFTFPATPAAGATRPEVLLNGTPHADAAAETDGLRDKKFRHWVFPTDSRSPRANKRRYSDTEEGEGNAEVEEVVQWTKWPSATLDVEDLSLSTQTSVEFPLRRTPPRHLSVVNSTPTPESTSIADLSLPPVTLPRETLGEMLATVKSVGEQIAQMHAAHDALLADSAGRARDADAQGTLAADTFDMIKDFFAGAPSFETVARTLETHTEILHEIQRRIDEETRTSAPVSPMRAENGAEGTGQAPLNLPDMFRVMISGQHAIMAKFGEFSEAQETVYDLRSATDALLEAQAEFRQAKVDARSGHEIVRLQDELRAQSARAARAEAELAVLRARLDAVAADQRLKVDLADATAALARVAAAEEQSSALFDDMCHQLSQQNATHHAAVEDMLKQAVDHSAEKQHCEVRSFHAESLQRHNELLERLGVMASRAELEAEKRSIEGERDAALSREAVARERLKALEREVDNLCAKLSEADTERRDLRVQLAQVRGEVDLASEKALRVADAEAHAKRNLELQMKAEKARIEYLESKAARAEAAAASVADDLDAWRSAALEQRLRAEQGLTRIAALQAENFHWREFALGADRHRLESWLNTRPFVGIEAAELPEPATPRARAADKTSGCPTPRPTPPSSANVQPKHPHRV